MTFVYRLIVMEKPEVHIEADQPAPWQAAGELWIAIPGQRAVPHKFWAVITDPALPYLLRIQVTLNPPANVAAVRNLVVSRREDTYPFGPDVTTAGLRGINVRRYLRLAVDAAARPITSAEPVTGIRGTFFVEGMSRDKAFGGPEGEKRGRGSQAEPGRLDVVASAYKAAKAAGQPVREAVMAVCHVEQSQAQRLIRAAREVGKLPPR